MLLRNFYLGTHLPAWFGVTDYRIFVSHNRLRTKKSFHPACDPWSADSGGFTNLSREGEWTESPASYSAAIRRYRNQIGMLEWAAPQDWMCEPKILAKTGLTVPEHQTRTVENYLELRSIAADLPFIPVLQGYTVDDYLRCTDLYEAYGINLEDYCPVGLGSVCRRQSTTEILHIVQKLQPLKLHGFGVKTDGLKLYGKYLYSSDSLAWSYTARYDNPLPGHEVWHINCANCQEYAEMWRRNLIRETSWAGLSF